MLNINIKVFEKQIFPYAIYNYKKNLSFVLFAIETEMPTSLNILRIILDSAVTQKYNQSKNKEQEKRVSNT